MYLTTQEAQEELKVSREKLRQLINSGELKAHKIGKARNSPIRISEDAIRDYMDKHVVIQQAP